MPAIDAVFTISAFRCSAPASFSIGRHSRVIRMIARRFTSSCMSTFLVVSWSSASPIPTPALLTSTSSRPNLLGVGLDQRAQVLLLGHLRGHVEHVEAVARIPSPAAVSFSGRRADSVIP